MNNKLSHYTVHCITHSLLLAYNYPRCQLVTMMPEFCSLDITLCNLRTGCRLKSTHSHRCWYQYTVINLAACPHSFVTACPYLLPGASIPQWAYDDDDACRCTNTVGPTLHRVPRDPLICVCVTPLTPRYMRCPRPPSLHALLRLLCVAHYRCVCASVDNSCTFLTKQ